MLFFRHWKIEEQPEKNPKKDGDENAVAIVKSVPESPHHWETSGKRELNCVSHDTRFCKEL